MVLNDRTDADIFALVSDELDAAAHVFMFVVVVSAVREVVIARR